MHLVKSANLQQLLDGAGSLLVGVDTEDGWRFDNRCRSALVHLSDTNTTVDFIVQEIVGATGTYDSVDDAVRALRLWLEDDIPIDDRAELTTSTWSDEALQAEREWRDVESGVFTRRQWEAVRERLKSGALLDVVDDVLKCDVLSRMFVEVDDDEVLHLRQARFDPFVLVTVQATDKGVRVEDFRGDVVVDEEARFSAPLMRNWLRHETEGFRRIIATRLATLLDQHDEVYPLASSPGGFASDHRDHRSLTVELDEAHILPIRIEFSLGAVGRYDNINNAAEAATRFLVDDFTGQPLRQTAEPRMMKQRKAQKRPLEILQDVLGPERLPTQTTDQLSDDGRRFVRGENPSTGDKFRIDSRELSTLHLADSRAWKLQNAGSGEAWFLEMTKKQRIDIDVTALGSRFFFAPHLFRQFVTSWLRGGSPLSLLPNDEAPNWARRLFALQKQLGHRLLLRSSRVETAKQNSWFSVDGESRSADLSAANEGPVVVALRQGRSVFGVASPIDDDDICRLVDAWVTNDLSSLERRSTLRWCDAAFVEAWRAQVGSTEQESDEFSLQDREVQQLALRIGDIAKEMQMQQTYSLGSDLRFLRQHRLEPSLVLWSAGYEHSQVGPPTPWAASWLTGDVVSVDKGDALSLAASIQRMLDAVVEHPLPEILGMCTQVAEQLRHLAHRRWDEDDCVRCSFVVGSHIVVGGGPVVLRLRKSGDGSRIWIDAFRGGRCTGCSVIEDWNDLPLEASMVTDTLSDELRWGPDRFLPPSYASSPTLMVPELFELCVSSESLEGNAAGICRLRLVQGAWHHPKGKTSAKGEDLVAGRGDSAFMEVLQEQLAAFGVEGTARPWTPPTKGDA